ncbi:MAG: hypothetical protein GX072_02070 [Lysinibacillus sp.]|nr:hypothetical protein [Lysinibacillus sp.]
MQRKSIFSLISKTHHFLLRENDEFLLLSKPLFSLFYLYLADFFESF